MNIYLIRNIISNSTYPLLLMHKVQSRWYFCTPQLVLINYNTYTFLFSYQRPGWWNTKQNHSYAMSAFFEIIFLLNPLYLFKNCETLTVRIFSTKLIYYKKYIKGHIVSRKPWVPRNTLGNVLVTVFFQQLYIFTINLWRNFFFIQSCIHM